MFLKRLELQGFKSFAAKTVIDFPERITAVVGPNGSGKSNIADAIRWLLGERESKSLRGAKSDDLIFAGTEHRSRSGFAQASIYFDNSSGFFPVEYKEVVITRRIDRDGDSRFLLNQSEIRLKDIINFFARGRMGARGLNIVSQGESDAFLRANPSERRVLIEEMLGLKEYLLKKRSSERELENTKVNLDKARTMLEEMKPHIKMLRRQVSRYIERDKLTVELTGLENAFYGAKAREILNELARFDPDLFLISNAITEKKKEIFAMEVELKEIESSEPEAKKKIEEIRQRRRELFNERLAAASQSVVKLSPAPILLKNEASRDDARGIFSPLLYQERNSSETENSPFSAKGDKKDPIALIREIKNLATIAVEITLVEDLRGAFKKILSLISELEEESFLGEPANPVAPSVLNPEFEVKMEAFNKALNELDAIERKFTAEIDGFNQVFRKAVRAVEVKKDELDVLEDKSAQISFEKEKVKYKKEEFERQLAAMDRTFAEFIDISGTEGLDFFATERRIYRIRGELASIGEVDESIITESEEAEERFESASLQIEELEKASADLKSLIKELDYKIHHEFSEALSKINKELLSFAKLMFGGGKISFRLEELIPSSVEVMSLEDETLSTRSLSHDIGQSEEDEPRQGIEIEVSLPKKRIKGLEVLSGGERSLLSIAILFGLISISPPPFIVLDEVDATLDERNARRLGEILNQFEAKTQFIIVTHNRATMESANALYGVTMGEDGTSKLVSLKLS